MVTLRCGNRTFTNIQAVIFDKDGTLSNSQPYLHTLALKRWTILEANLEAKIADRAPAHLGETLFQTWGLRDDCVDPKSMLAVASGQENEIVTAGYLAALGWSWIEALSIVQEAFAIATAALPPKHELTPTFPGISSLLQTLKSKGLKLAVLSADVLPNIHHFLCAQHLNTYIDFCQGVEPGLLKPNPKLLDLTCTGLGISPSQCLVIGDSSADIELAKRGGAAGAIGVAWGWDTDYDLPQVDVMLRSVDEIEVMA